VSTRKYKDESADDEEQVDTEPALGDGQIEHVVRRWRLADLPTRHLEEPQLRMEQHDHRDGHETQAVDFGDVTA
jgi:hypothetical protein